MHFSAITLVFSLLAAPGTPGKMTVPSLNDCDDLNDTKEGIPPADLESEDETPAGEIIIANGEGTQASLEAGFRLSDDRNVRPISPIRNSA